MKLKEWNVWHNTTTHLFGLPDLRVVAEKIVESGLCRAVYHTDGMAYWKQNGAIVSCEVISKNDKSGFSLNLNCKDKPDDYIAEGIYQASLMYEYEKEIYSDFVIGNLVYIRGVLDIFLLNLDGLLIRLYPMLKIYENGVITISYRILPTERDINIDYLVENIINLFKKDIHDIKLSPNIMLLDGTRFLLSEQVNIFKRAERLKRINLVAKIIRSSSSVIKSGNFEFRLCSIDPLKIEKLPRFRFGDIRQYIVSSIITSVSKPRKGWFYLLFGPKVDNSNQGGLWTNRPQVYILSYEGQPDKVDEIENYYADELVKILIRNSKKPRKPYANYFDNSLRTFDDMAIYMNEGIGLTVYSQTGYKNVESSADPNKNNIYFTQQIKSEYIDYIYISFHKFLEMVYLPAYKYESLASIREQLNYYKIIQSKISVYGELNGYFKKAFEILRLNEIESQINDGIIVKMDKMKEYSDKNLIKFGYILSLIMGLIGGVGIVDMILVPFWKYYKFGDSINIPKELLGTYLYIAFIVFLSGSTLILYKLLTRKRPI